MERVSHTRSHNVKQGDFAAVSNVAHKCQLLHHSLPSCSLLVWKARGVRVGAQELQAREP